MDFQFQLDFQSIAIARCAMPHEAIANWLNSEIYGDIDLLLVIQQVIKRCRTHCNPNYSEELIGREFTLTLSAEEAIIQANTVLEQAKNSAPNYDEAEAARYAYENNIFAQNASIEFPAENLSLYDDESCCRCGLDDFSHFIESYRSFITEP